jgi:3-oxoacyl-[acyl-carrier-protein] synthase II
MNKRVVVTGINMITSLGLNYKETWDNLVLGKSGIKRITLFDPSNLQTQIAGQIPDNFDAYSENFIKKRNSVQMTRVTRMFFACASEAIELSGINFDECDKSRCAVIAGVVDNANNSIEPNDPKNRIVKGMSNAMPAWISIKYKIEGPSFSVNTACASSAYAIALGFDMIKNGLADIVITGGADSTINKEEIEGFNELYALSTRNNEPEKASRPFSADRDGFVIGEGAGVIIMESLEFAQKRDAFIYGELAGYALTNESYNIMAPMKDGEGMAKTMAKALQNANIDPSSVDYINAHGTSTILNDRFETMAIKKVFGDYSAKIPVTSSKSMIGHTIGAAGAIESIITLLTINNGIITPTINYENPDPDLTLNYVPNKAIKKEVNCAISNSFAFGGHNASLVFKKYKNC